MQKIIFWNNVYWFLYKNKIMSSPTYIFDVCEQKQMILSLIITFNALSIYRWCNVPFSSGNKALIKNLYRFKKTQFSEITGRIFKDKLQQGRSGNVINRDLKTCSAEQRHETGRLNHTRTEENVITADEIVGLLNHKGQKQTYGSIRQISKKMI